MSAPRVIPATFHNYRTVLGRKVLQLVFEVPIEQQNETLRLLGYPNAAEPSWYAIARLANKPGGQTQEKGTERRERTMAERCAILCNDARFRDYLTRTWGVKIMDSARADFEIKSRLGIESKTELNEGAPSYNAEAAANFKLLVMTYESHIADQEYAHAHRR